MLTLSKMIQYFAIVYLAIFISGCGVQTDQPDPGQALMTCDLPQIPNSAGTACIDPPAIVCPVPLVPNANNDACVVGADPNAPEPSVKPGPNQAILFYNRPQDASNDANDPVYDGYKLHTWNNEECDAYAPPFDTSDWADGHPFDGIDPNYGAYWILELKEGYGSCGNFIIHIGTDGDGKELGGADFQMNLVQDDPDFVRMNWTISGYAGVFEYPITSLGDLPLQIADRASHWIDANTLVWDIDPALATEIKLHHSANADIAVDDNGNLSGDSFTLTATTLSDAQKAAAPQVADWPAFVGDWTLEQAKAMLKEQLVIAAFDADGPYLATGVQNALAIDALYTAGDNDANEATVGIVYNADGITANLWAPTAQSVALNIYDASKTLISTNPMTEDPATGIWTFSTDMSADRQFYRYQLQVYHSQNDQIETVEVTDPYSLGLSTNGDYSQFVNLADADLKPEGWDSQTVPVITNPEDAVIYEGHIRDFSIRDDSTSVANRGKYMAFTESGSAPMQHLQSLAQAGVTHFHLLPANDIASINEDPAMVVNLDNTVADLCALNASAPVCGVESDSATLLSVLQSYPAYSSDAQALVESMRGIDSFNWGYDPKHFTAPEGSYASDPDGAARIIEFRSMIMALHESGLRTALDVVYNHTNSAGLWDNSVLDKVVPGYYHNLDLTSGTVIQSTCCNDTAPEHKMMEKLIADSLTTWASEYGIDAFRFDIMSHHPKAQILAAREAVRAVDPDTFFYGEGWYRDDQGRGYENATQHNMAGSEVATFNDRLRDGVRGASLFNGDSSSGSMNQQDIVKLGMAGTLANYVLKSSSGLDSTGSAFSPDAYGLDPADVINYVSKHDDRSLWDQLQYNLNADTSLQDRVRIQNIAAAIPLMSQGIPFLQMGGDLMRSKSMDRNSYDSGDWFNFVDFTMASNNWNVGLPLAGDNGSDWDKIVGIASSPLTAVGTSDVSFASQVFKEFLTIRRDSPLFRLTTEADILARVGFHNIGSNQKQGVIVMSIDDGIGLDDLDPAYDALVVMINGTDSDQSVTVNTASGFTLHPTLLASADSRVATASFSEGSGDGSFNVPARTMAVFVKAQGASQGEGLSAYATSGAPDVVPYGDTAVYLRGDMNGWSTDNAFNYMGDGVYQVAVSLTGGTPYNFKFASEDWSTVNYGNNDGAVTEGVDKPLIYNAGNLNFTPSVSSEYFFEVNASDPANPVLNIRNADIYQATPIYIRGGINGWGTSSELTYQGNGIYKVIIDVTGNSGVQEFKVASSDWSTVDLTYGDGDALVTEDLDKLLGAGAGLGNMNMDFTVDGEYTFILNASNPDLQYLSVHQTQMYGAQTIYLKGSFNGWGNVDELVYQGDSTYQVDMALTAGSYEFKFANADWSDINYGASADDPVINIGEPKPLYFNTANIQLTIAADGNYRFTVTGPDDHAPKMTVTLLP